jgi:hypothetical protein
MFRAANGTYYVASDYGMWRATNPSHWEKIAGPNGNPVISDGENLIVGIRFPWQSDPDKHFLTAPESDPSTWSVLASPPLTTVEGLGGPTTFAYDADHQVLYVSMATLGLRRVRLH